MEPTYYEKIDGEFLNNIIYHGIFRGIQYIENESLLFENTNITNKTTISHGSRENIRELAFKDCRFDKELELLELSNINAITFENCYFASLIYIKNYRIPIRFSKCTFDNQAMIHASSATSGNKLSSLEILQCSIKSKLTLSGHCNGGITIKEINSANHKNGEIEFSRVSTMKLICSEVHCTSLIFTVTNIFEGDVDFVLIDTDKLILNNIEIGVILRITLSEINELTIDNLRGAKNIEIKDSLINKVTISAEMISKLTIANCEELGEIEFWGTHKKDSYLNIERTSLKILNFNQVINEGLITLRQIRISEGKLRIISSNLGKIDFLLCDFSNASLEFENSKISEAFFSETDFPKVVLLNNKINFAQAQLIFGQLHTAFQKQGDTVRSLEYQSREIEAHYKKIGGLIKKGSHNISFTWLNLWLNKISNNFGRNWIRGIVFSFAVGVVFFYCLVISTEKYQLGFNIIPTSDLTKAFFRFMNPLRFIELEKVFDEKTSLSSWSFVWDLMGRIFVAYGFYQTIQAFRRFGRK